MSTTPASVATRPAPSRWWYVFAAFLFVIGFVLMAAFLVPRILAMGEGMQQVVVPGSAHVMLEKPGTYTIFHERESVVGDEVFSSQNVDGLKVRVVDAAGANVTVSPVTVSSSYNIGGRSGHALLTFEAAEPGLYRLIAGYGNDASEPRVVLAVGHDFIQGLLTTILGALGFALAGTGAGVITAYMTWRSRKRARAG